MTSGRLQFMLAWALAASLLLAARVCASPAARQSPATAAGGAEAEVRAAVNEYFEALRNKDWQRLTAIEMKRNLGMSVGGSDSHGPLLALNVSLEMTKRLLTPYEIRTLSFTTDKVEVKGGEATVHATVNVEAGAAGTDTAAILLREIEMVLHLDNFQSTWRVNIDHEGDGILSERVKSAGTAAGRQFLLSLENTSELSLASKKLKSEGVALLERKSLKQAFVAFGLAQEVQLHLRERAAVAAELRAKLREADAEECRTSGRQKDLARNLLWAGQDYAELKDFAKAEERLGESIKLLDALGDNRNLARAYKEAAAAALEQGKYPQAVDSYQNSIDKFISLATEDRDERNHALSEVDDAVIHVAYLYSAQGKYDQAEEFIQRNSKRFEDLGEVEEAFLMSYVLSVLEMARGDYRRAADTLEKLLLRLEQDRHGIEDKEEVIAGVQLMLVQMYGLQSNFVAGARHLENMRLANVKAEDAAAWSNILLLMDGMLYGGQGNEDLEMSLMQRSLSGIMDSGLEDVDIPDILQTWSMSQMSRSIFSTGDRIGDLSQEEFDLSLQCLLFSASLAEKAGDAIHAASAHRMIAALYAIRNNPAAEAEHFLKGLSLLEGPATSFKDLYETQPLADELLLDLADVYRSQKKYEEAIATYKKILKQDRLALFRMDETRIRLHTAEAYYSLKEFGEAVRYALEAERDAERSGDADAMKDAYLIAGDAYRALGQPEEAGRSYQSAVDDVELERSRINGSEPSAAQFFEDKVKPYQAMTGLLISDGDTDAALSYAERGKSKVLLDVLRNGRRSAARLMSAEELKQDDDLRRQLMLLNGQVIRAQAAHTDEAEVRQLRARRVEARLDYELFRAKLYVKHPELAERRSAEADSFKVEDLRLLLDSSDEAALEFMVTDEKTYLFVLTRKEGAGGAGEAEPAAQEVERNVYEIDIGADALEGLINNFRIRISHPDGVIGRRARDLYELLLGRAREQLAGKKSLIIIPDGILWNLPFQALMPSEGRYLLDDYAISYAPSLTALKEMNRLRDERALQSARGRGIGPTLSALRAPSLMAVGDPGGCEQGNRCGESPDEVRAFEPLPGAGRLARRLRDLYGARNSLLYSGRGVDEATIKREAPKYQVIHIGTHGVLDDDNPMYSFLLLASAAEKGKGPKVGGERGVAEDGFLEAWELMELHLKAEMIVLSACDTARGKVRNGEGIVGLSWAALLAGCPTVVVGQWKVDEAGTSQLMYDFHRRWLEERKTAGAKVGVAAALRQSALALRAGKRYSHPYYWAGFSVVGVGR